MQNVVLGSVERESLKGYGTSSEPTDKPEAEKPDQELLKKSVTIIRSQTKAHQKTDKIPNKKEKKA